MIPTTADDPDQSPHPKTIISHGYGPEVESAHDLPEGLDAEESGVGDAVPVVPSDVPVNPRPGETTGTHGVIVRGHRPPPEP
jgi:hypothetical protein